MTLYLRAPGNWCGVVNLQAQRAPGNWRENPEPQEVNSLVRNPGSDNRASGNGLRECLQRFETLEKRFNLREFVVKMRHSREESLLG